MSIALLQSRKEYERQQAMEEAQQLRSFQVCICTISTKLISPFLFIPKFSQGWVGFLNVNVISISLTLLACLHFF